jgi:hypothetical protein
LAGFLCDTLNSEITVQLPTLAAQLTEARYQAWQEWQRLQQRYLNPQVRKDFHLQCCNLFQQQSVTLQKALSNNFAYREKIKGYGKKSPIRPTYSLEAFLIVFQLI